QKGGRRPPARGDYSPEKERLWNSDLKMAWRRAQGFHARSFGRAADQKPRIFQLFLHQKPHRRSFAKKEGQPQAPVDAADLPDLARKICRSLPLKQKIAGGSSRSPQRPSSAGSCCSTIWAVRR